MKILVDPPNVSLVLYANKLTSELFANKSAWAWMKHVKDSTEILATLSQDVKMVLYATALEWLEPQEQETPVNSRSQKACSSNVALIQNAVLALNAVMRTILVM